MREPTTPVDRVSAGLQYHRGRQQGTVDRSVTDLRNSKIWEVPFIVDGDLSDILDTDPWEVVVQVPMTPSKSIWTILVPSLLLPNACDSELTNLLLSSCDRDGYNFSGYTYKESPAIPHRQRF